MKKPIKKLIQETKFFFATQYIIFLGLVIADTITMFYFTPLVVFFGLQTTMLTVILFYYKQQDSKK